MDQQGIIPTLKVYRSLLKACAERKSLAQAKQVHAHLVKHGFEQTIGESVVSTFAKCGGLRDALQVFHRLSNPSAFTWTALMSGYNSIGDWHETLHLYQCMQEKGVQPSTYTFVSLLKACASLADLQEGKRIHAQAVKYRCESDVFVGTSLVDMYGRCGSIADAQDVFYRLPQRNVVSWTVMLAAYFQQGQSERTLELYDQMQKEGVSPNKVTFLNVLQACGMLAEKDDAIRTGYIKDSKPLKKGRAVHADIRSKGYDSDLVVGNTLVSMYGKCGSIVDAQSVFDGLPDKDVVSWNAMLAAYVHEGESEKALQLYKQLCTECVSPNARTFVSILQACAILGEREGAALNDMESTNRFSLEVGRSLHADALRKRYDSNVFVCNTLIRMYGKCGSIEDARKVFDGLSEPNVVSWNAMLAAYVQQGLGLHAIQLYKEMQENFVASNERTFLSVLQACGILADKGNGVNVQSEKQISLQAGRTIHAEARKKGYDTQVFVGNTLISMYGKVGSSLDACHVFGDIVDHNIVSWNALLGVLVDDGQGDKVLQFYHQMQEDGLSPDGVTFVSAIQACGLLAERESNPIGDLQLTKAEPLALGKELHANARRKGYDSDVFVGNTLVSMYRKCGSIVEAQDVFDRLSQPDKVSWNAMLVAYAQQGQAAKTLQLYELMLDAVVSPDVWTCVSALQACGALSGNAEGKDNGQTSRLKSLEKGKAIHADARIFGFDSNDFVVSTLISMYGKCGSVADAMLVFGSLSNPNVVSWNAMLQANVEQGQSSIALELYEEMQERGVSPDARTCVTVLQACGMLAEKEPNAKFKCIAMGEAIHANAQGRGHVSDVFVGGALVTMYRKLGRMEDAWDVFTGLSERNLVLWNMMLSAYIEEGQPGKALLLYEQMQEEVVGQDAWTFVSALQACGMLAEKEKDGNARNIKEQLLAKGMAIHGDVQRKGCDSDLFVGSTLISMYGKCGSIANAQSVFDELPSRNVVSWNALLAAYVEQGKAETALQLFRQMQRERMSPDVRTFVTMTQACSMLADKEEHANVDGCLTKAKSLKEGRAIHDEACEKGCDSDVFLGNTLVNMYGRCGSILDAQRVFDGLLERNIVSWNAMLAAYIVQGLAKEAFQLYDKMQEEGVSPDARTCVSALQACGMLSVKESDAVTWGAAIHTYAERKGYASDVFVASTLISMYGKCGRILKAQKVFDSLAKRDVVSWNAMLTACIQRGEGEKALQLYKQMQEESVSPDEITYSCILQACSNTGSLASLRQIHEGLVSREQKMSPLLVSSIIHAYGRCCSMVDAQTVFDSLPHPDVVSWTALIAGYAWQGDTVASLRSYGRMLEAGVNPNGVTFLSLLSACGHAGLVDKGVEYFESMSRNYGITPAIEHYVSMVDLLGRAGHFKMLRRLLVTMPVEPDLAMWLCLLGACRKHRKVALGKLAFDEAVSMEPANAAAYVLMTNIYNDAGLVDRAEKVTVLRGKSQVTKKPAQSWIQADDDTHSFMVHDRNHSQQEQLYGLLRKMNFKLKVPGFTRCVWL